MSEKSGKMRGKIRCTRPLEPKIPAPAKAPAPTPPEPEFLKYESLQELKERLKDMPTPPWREQLRALRAAKAAARGDFPGTLRFAPPPPSPPPEPPDDDEWTCDFEEITGGKILDKNGKVIGAVPRPTQGK